MPIEIDWQVTEAPSGDDIQDDAPRLPPRERPLQVPPTSSGTERPRASGRGRWWLRLPLILVIAAVLGLNYLTRLGWQRLSADVIALVRYEDQLAEQGETFLMLRVQDYTSSQWLSVRSAQVAARQPAPLPVPVLTLLETRAAIGPLELVATDWVRTEVSRQYLTPDGQRLTFALPQFYRRQGNDENWVRTATPDSYWGTWQDWQSEHLSVRHSQRDTALVEALGPRVETLLAKACAVWGETCAGLPPARLFLSGFVGSLEYDPLSNIRVRVEYGDAQSGQQLPAGYFLSVPSPQMAGVPADAAAEQYFSEYLAVRLIASLAAQATDNQSDADRLTTAAVAQLGLGRADPGFATVADQRPRGEDGLLSHIVTDPVEQPRAVAHPSRLPNPGSALVTRLKPTEPLLTYEVQMGDTLSAIAGAHQVSLEALILLNGISNPDFIQAGTRLLIPPVEQ